MTARVSTVQDVGFEGIQDCVIAGGVPLFVPPATMNCVLQAPFADLTGWDISEFDVYRKTSFGPAPSFFAAPALTDPGEYPNTVSSTTGATVVAAAVDCNNLPAAAALRWVWSKQPNGICYNVPTYNVVLCSASGVNRNNDLYENGAGEQLASDAINYDVFCPS